MKTKKHKNTNIKDNNINNESDSDRARAPHRCHRKHRRLSDHHCSSPEGESFDILCVKKKKQKKVRRDASSLTSTLLTLCLKSLTTKSAARAASYGRVISFLTTKKKIAT